MMPAVLLLDSGQEARHVDPGHDREVETVAEAHEARRLDAGVDVEHAGQIRRLVGDDADRATADAREADHHVLGVVLVNLEQVAVVDHRADHVLHVVGLAALGRHHRVELGDLAIDRVVGGPERGILGVVRGQKPQQLPRLCEARAIVGRHEVADAALRGVALGAAELLLGDVFVGHGADHFRTGDEHVARLLDHQDEVGDGRRVHGAARARTEDAADLRDDAARQRVAQKDVGVAGERLHALLDARAARIVESDHRARRPWSPDP